MIPTPDQVPDAPPESDSLTIREAEVITAALTMLPWSEQDQRFGRWVIAVPAMDTRHKTIMRVLEAAGWDPFILPAEQADGRYHIHVCKPKKR